MSHLGPISHNFGAILTTLATTRPLNSLYGVPVLPYYAIHVFHVFHVSIHSCLIKQLLGFNTVHGLYCSKQDVCSCSRLEIGGILLTLMMKVIMRLWVHIFSFTTYRAYNFVWISKVLVKLTHKQTQYKLKGWSG